MTRLVAIGDAHLQHGHRRNADRLQALDQIIREGSALDDLGAWLWPGDIFHQRSLPEDRNEVAPRLQAMADRAPVVMVYGNHDHPGDLHILGRLKARYPIYVIDRPDIVRVQLATGQTAAIFGVPYPHKAEIVAHGISVQDVGTTAAPLLDLMFLAASERLREAAAAGDLTVMIGHATIVGSVSSVGQPMGLERDVAIDAGLLARLGDIPKIFGHIHKPQELHGAHYIGSIGRNDWGEVEAKRYLSVEFGGVRRFPLHASGEWAIYSHPITSTPLWHVEGDLTRDGFDWTVRRGPDGESLEPPRVPCPGEGPHVSGGGPVYEYETEDGPFICPICRGDNFITSWQGAEVRVRYRFNADEQAALDLTLVRTPFAGAARIELDPIANRNRAIRAESVVRAASVPEKLAAYVQHTGGTWTPSIDAKLALLQMADGTAFLNSVVAQPALQEVA